jgi:hypothetical protein
MPTSAAGRHLSGARVAKHGELRREANFAVIWFRLEGAPEWRALVPNDRTICSVVPGLTFMGAPSETRNVLAFAYRTAG